MSSIKFRRSSASGLEPTSSQVNEGELAINLYDKKIYTADQNGDIINIGFSQEYADETYLALTGGIMKGKLYLKAGSLPVSTNAGLDEVISRRYVDNQFGTSNTQTRRNLDLDNRYVQTAGGSTIQNSLSLNYNPAISGNQSLATNVKFVKDYFLYKLGDAMQGNLLLASHPTTDFMAATKYYVDQRKIEANQYTDSKYNSSIAYTNQQVSSTTSALQSQIAAASSSSSIEYADASKTIFVWNSGPNGSNFHYRTVLFQMKVVFAKRGEKTVYFPYSPAAWGASTPTISITKEHLHGGNETDFVITTITPTYVVFRLTETGDGKGDLDYQVIAHIIGYAQISQNR